MWLPSRNEVNSGKPAINHPLEARNENLSQMHTSMA